MYLGWRLQLVVCTSSTYAALRTPRALKTPRTRIISSMAEAARFDIARTSKEVEVAAAATIADYASVAEGYAAGNMNHDVSQNIQAMLDPLRSSPIRHAPFDVLDVCCASGRDLLALKTLGHRPIGIDGVEQFCEMSRELSGCEVWQQSLTELDLPEQRFDAIFCNACLFHVPSVALPDTMRALAGALRPGGTLFVSNAHGFGEDREGWTNGRTPGTRSYVTWLSEESWVETVKAATGLNLLQLYYRPPGKLRSQQPFLATVWQR